MVNWFSLYAERARPDQQDLVSGSGRPVIQMAAGFPDTQLFPTDELTRIVQEVTAADGASLLQYNAPGGYEPLRAWVADRASTSTLALESGHVLLTNGAQQGLDLVTKLLIDKGDWVLAEGPTFHGALGTFQTGGARIAQVPVDEHGIVLEALADKLRAMAAAHCLPKFIYTIPTFHNPTGCTATLERRLGLLELAGEYGVPIVEDVPYNDLWYDDAPPPPTLLELSDTDLVIQLGTFSKTLCPGFRVGWLIATPEFVRKAWGFKHLTDTCSSPIMQRVAHQLASNGFLEQNVIRARDLYRAKRDALIGSFAQLDMPGLQVSRPTGGFFAWLKLPAGLSSRQFQQVALDCGVSIAAGPMFFADGQFDEACRLTISYPSVEEIRVGVATLGEAVHLLQQNV